VDPHSRGGQPSTPVAAGLSVQQAQYGGLGDRKSSVKRIGFVWHGDRNIGGGDHSTFELARHLKPEFCAVLIYGKHNRLVEQYKEAGIETVQIRFHPDITNVYRDSIRTTPLSLVKYARRFLETAWCLWRTVRDYDLQLLHPIDNLSKIIAGIVGRFAPVPVVSHCHDELTPPPIDRFLRGYQAVMMDAVIAVTNRVRERMVLPGFTNRKVVTIFNGVDADIFDPGCVERSADFPFEWVGPKTVVGMIAVFDECKGHEHLFEACAPLKRMGLNH
jgi:glycosyltransferase involved in cell wall biosynthesis